jgi:ankyrin repeat protein
MRGDLPAIERLLDAGAAVDARDEHNQTALMNAARDGRVAVVRLLAARGASLDHRAKYGLTALMLAALGGHVEIARILVAAGADPTPRGTGAPGFHGRTALDLAEARGDDDMLDVLDPRPRGQRAGERS